MANKDQEKGKTKFVVLFFFFLLTQVECRNSTNGKNWNMNLKSTFPLVQKQRIIITCNNCNDMINEMASAESGWFPELYFFRSILAICRFAGSLCHGSLMKTLIFSANGIYAKT